MQLRFVRKVPGLSPVDKPTFIPSGFTGTHPCTTVFAACRTSIPISSSPAGTPNPPTHTHESCRGSCTCSPRPPACRSHEAQKITCAATATPSGICLRWLCCACCRIVDMEYVMLCVLCQVKSQHFSRLTQRMDEYKCNAYVLCQVLTSTSTSTSSSSSSSTSTSTLKRCGCVPCTYRAQFQGESVLCQVLPACSGGT